MAESEYDIMVIGQGAAAFSAGLYAARYQVKTIVVGQTFGGETATGGLIENYPGHVEIQGFDLMLGMKEQVQKYDVPVIDAKVTRHRAARRLLHGPRRRGRRVPRQVGCPGDGTGAPYAGART